ncbi:MAG: hypothetical protein JW976_05875 [Syntrophaceae bacterium]|nr:hypothetical protein [Syntrophaceae bacterium]
MDIKELKVAGKSSEKRNHPWEHARCKVIFNILKSYINETSQPLNVIDIGCGDLFFLKQFCKKFTIYHPVAIAVDTALDDELIYSLKNKYQDLHVDIYKNFQDVKLREGYANIVFLMDVIEHIENSQNFLEFLFQQSYITKKSLFVIAVPAFNNLFSTHDKWLGHYRRYSQQELKKTIENAGYQYVKGGYFFTTLLLARIMQNYLDILLKKKNKEVKGIGNWNRSIILSFLFEKFLLCDYYFSKLFSLIGIKIPGLSTYILCRPQ